MIYLHQIPGSWGASSLSPFCIKLELWLKMAGLPYEERPVKQNEMPKGKVPYVSEDGRILGDSQLIIEHLTQKHGVTLDDHLTVKQRAIGRAMRRMLEEGTYWVVVASRWQFDDGWQELKPSITRLVPGGLGAVVAPLLRAGVKKQVHAQGTGRHSPEELLQMGAADIDALAELMDGNAFVMGDLPSSFDATVYAFLRAITCFPIENVVSKAVKNHANLLAYMERIQQKYGIA